MPQTHAAAGYTTVLVVLIVCFPRRTVRKMVVIIGYCVMHYRRFSTCTGMDVTNAATCGYQADNHKQRCRGVEPVGEQSPALR